MSNAATFNLIEQERYRLANLADGWSPAQWDEPSLAEGWSVREVIAHLTRRFEATDLDWSHGTGPTERATSIEIIAHLCRAQPLPQR